MEEICVGNEISYSMNIYMQNGCALQLEMNISNLKDLILRMKIMKW